MTLGLRILRGYAGTRYLTPYDTTTSGWWNNIAEPRAYYYNGKTYFGFVDDAGNIYVSSYNHVTGATSTPFLVGNGFSSPSGDVHNSIALLVRSSDHKILLVEDLEGGSQPFARVSSNAEDVTSWASPYNILNSGNYTYCALFQLNNGDIYLFLRSIVGGVFYLGYSKSTDGGATWSNTVSLISPRTDAGNPDKANYWRINTDGVNIHFLVTDTSRVDAHPSAVYHMYFDGTTMYSSDGTSLGSSFPILVTNGTLVQDASLGPAWSEGVSFDGNGTPIGVLLIYSSGTPKNLVKFVRWNGTSWDVSSVTDTVAIQGGNKFVSGAAIGKTTPPYTIWISRKVGSFFELFRYTSTDGSTWTELQLTTGSSNNVAMMDTPINAHHNMELIFGRGTYTSDSIFSFNIWRV